MKKIQKLCFLALVGLMVGTSCEKTPQAPDPAPTSCKSCANQTFLKQTKGTKGTVKKVNQGDYFYDGGVYYVEVSSIDFPELNETASTVRLFPCSRNLYNEEHVGSEVSLNVNVFLCSTDNHGSESNNFHIFNLFN